MIFLRKSITKGKVGNKSEAEHVCLICAAGTSAYCQYCAKLHVLNSEDWISCRNYSSTFRLPSCTWVKRSRIIYAWVLQPTSRTPHSTPRVTVALPLEYPGAQHFHCRFVLWREMFPAAVASSDTLIFNRVEPQRDLSIELFGALWGLPFSANESVCS